MRTAYFSADDGNGQALGLWKTNGTVAGTTLIQEFPDTFFYANLHDLTNFNGTLFFTASDGASGQEHGRAMVRPPERCCSKTFSRAQAGAILPA